MFPWLFNKYQLKRYAKSGKFYVLYVHPFELSLKKVPYVKDAGFKNRIRSTLGRKRIAKRVTQVIKLLRENGYEFVTYRELRELTLRETSAPTREP